MREYRFVQIALDVRSSIAPAVARPVLVARNGEPLPLRLVSPIKRIAGQDKSRTDSAAARPEETSNNDTPTRSTATPGGSGSDPVASSRFLAQQIAQEESREIRPNKARDEASVAAYRGAAERGTVFFGLEYPVDFTV